MNTINIDKGLRYEFGKLTEKIDNLRPYYNLPQELQRLIYFIALPKEFLKIYRKTRTNKIRNLQASCFKPFLETKSIFFHIPKTAGISVSHSLYGRKTGEHRTVLDYKICFSKKELNSFFKFTFVRNPWDRLASAYFFVRNGGRNDFDRSFFEKYLSQYQDFEDFVLHWVNRENIFSGLHFRPQYDFICDHNKKIQVDFIGHFESLEKDYEYIQKKVLTAIPLQFQNKTQNKDTDYRCLYTPEMKEIVAEVYQEDINLFGYDFDNIFVTQNIKCD